MSLPEFEAAAAAFGASIRSAREAHGMSQAALGKKIGLDGPSISRIENGSRAIFLADALALQSVLMLAPPASPAGHVDASLAYVRVKRAAGDLAALTAEFEDLRELLAPAVSS